jgi:hypothetical protein
MELKYGLLVLGLILCIVGGAYATGTGPDDITNDLTNLIGVVTNHNTDTDQAPVSTDPGTSATNGTETPVSASTTSDVSADNVDNNVVTSIQKPVYAEQGPNTPIMIQNGDNPLISGNYGGPSNPPRIIVPGENLSGNYGGPGNPHGGTIIPGQNPGNYGGPSHPGISITP